MEVKRLEAEEKESTRALYAEAFPEDSVRARDYYYETRMRENRVYAIRNGSEVMGMLCLNPCRVRFGDKDWDLSYIVAVATGKKYRRQGVMRRILITALLDEYAEKKPFVFLKPANPDYYTPFQFAYASKREKRILKNDVRYHCKRVDTEDDALLAELSCCANGLLGEKYQCYCLRSPAYLRQIGGELSAGDGRMLSVWERQDGGERLIGMECFDYADTVERDARLVLPETASIKFCGTEPFIMVRVLSLPEFFAGISLRPEVCTEERELLFSLKDPLIEENNGLFLLRATKKGSRIERLEAELRGRQEVTALTPEELVSVFFGMKHVSWAEELTSYRAYFDEEM